jgi:hypothetical protein
MMNRPTDDETATTIHVVPKTASEIPGLGPIRVRALVKAGFGDLKALRTATIEELTAVPGMSEIKARHIQSFLSQFTTEDLETVNSRAEEASRHCVAEPGDDMAPPVIQPKYSPGVTVRADAAPQLPATLAHEGENVLNLALALLLAESAPGYRARLLRETISFMQLVKILLQCTLPDLKSQERALRRLQAVGIALANALADTELDRKAQTRLADELAQAGDRLEALIGRTLYRRSTELADE